MTLRIEDRLVLEGARAELHRERFDLLGSDFARVMLEETGDSTAAQMERVQVHVSKVHDE